jgi:hypothetical protein
MRAPAGSRASAQNGKFKVPFRGRGTRTMRRRRRGPEPNRPRTCGCTGLPRAPGGSTPCRDKTLPGFVLHSTAAVQGPGSDPGQGCRLLRTRGKSLQSSRPSDPLPARVRSQFNPGLPGAGTLGKALPPGEIKGQRCRARWWNVRCSDPLRSRAARSVLRRRVVRCGINRWLSFRRNRTGMR